MDCWQAAQLKPICDLAYRTGGRPAIDVRVWHESEVRQPIAYVGFSNRPFGVKHFQTIHHYSVDVARGLALLFGIGTEALPAWDSKTRWNNL